MQFKPFAHLARVSFAKGLTHGAAPTVVAAGQSINGFHNYPTGKLSKASQLQHVLSNSSSSGAGAGPKAGYATQSSGGDAGLAQYYAAWQHAQQTGDDTEWKQHLSARNVGWKQSDKVGTSAAQSKQLHRLESGRALDVLKTPSRIVPARAHSDNVVYDVKKAEDALLAEAEAIVAVDEAIANEIQDIKESQVDQKASASSKSTQDVLDTEAAQLDEESAVESVDNSVEQLLSTQGTSPMSSFSDLSETIVRLGQQGQYAAIAPIYAVMKSSGIAATTEAYNNILRSAVIYETTYKPWPAPTDIFSDMSAHSVPLDQTTYSLLLGFWAARGSEAFAVQKDLDQRREKYGTPTRAFVLDSARQQQELYAGDTSALFIARNYSIARATINGFSMSEEVYNLAVKAVAQAGLTDTLTTILSDMKAKDVNLHPSLYTVVIDAYALSKDVDTAKQLYQEYREHAIVRSANDPVDLNVYASLIKAYYNNGQKDIGLEFYQRILQSFQGAAEQQTLSAELTNAVVMNAFVKHHLENRSYDAAIQDLSEFTLDVETKDRALATISAGAANAGVATIATSALSAITPAYAAIEAKMALTSMYLRQGNVAQARDVWQNVLATAPVGQVDTDFIALYTLSLIRTGAVEDGLFVAREMFQQARRSTPQNMLGNYSRVVDESIRAFGKTLGESQAILSPKTSITLLRMMIENGGYVSPVAENAIACLGPDCVYQLNTQDIALALHAQASLLQRQSDQLLDSAHDVRFLHLLETVLNRSIAMDPATVMVVEEMLPKVKIMRPDLAMKWDALLRPARSQTILQPTVPAGQYMSAPRHTPNVEAYEPYGHTTDHRTSKIISDLVESTSSRADSNLMEALDRLRNVRRIGRHLTYIGYAKLITAAGKVKRRDLMQQILNMANTDMPLMTDVASVRTGWVLIYDSVVAGCVTLGDRQMASQYHQELRNLGAAPSANTFGIYINNIDGAYDEASEAVRIFHQGVAEGIEPTVFLYNAVISKLANARRIDDCEMFFGDLIKRRLQPTSVTYGTMINAFCRTSREAQAEEMFDEMESAPTYKPRVAPYNTIMQYYLNTKRDRSKVLQYYERMKTKHIQPSSHTYKLLVEAHASLEPVNLEAAEQVLQVMKSAGIEPEAVHFGTLIHAKGCVLQDIAGARAIFDSVLANPAIRPTDNIYQNLLESMVANHEVSKTGEIVEDMGRRGVRMTPYIANTLIHGWAGASNIANALAVYDQLGFAKREPSTYEAMTRAFLSAGDRDSASDVVREMLKKGYPAAVADKIITLVGGLAP